MTENENVSKPEINEEDIQNVLNDIKETYPSHSAMPEDERIKNDVRTSISMFMNKVYLWTHPRSPKIASETALNTLFEKGFDKISNYYEGDNKKYLEEVLSSELKKYEGDKEPTEVQKMTTKLLKGNYQRLFGEKE